MCLSSQLKEAAVGRGSGFLSTLDSHNLLSGNHYLRMFTKWFVKAKEVN